MTEKITPLKNRVLIQILPEEERTERGIILVESKKPSGATKRAKVIAVGFDVTSVNTGDVVLILGYAGTQIGSTDGGADELRIIPEQEVLAIFDLDAEQCHDELDADESQELSNEELLLRVANIDTRLGVN